MAFLSLLLLHHIHPLVGNPVLDIIATKCWTPRQQHDFSCDLCDLFVACGIPWNAASNPQLQIFCKKWITGAEIPDRRALSGSILKERVVDVKGHIKEKVKGKMAMGQCDRWKNVMKMPLVASMITVDYQVQILFLSLGFMLTLFTVQTYYTSMI